MEDLKSVNSRKKCTLVLEATELSKTFEKRIVTFRPGADVGVGRVSRKEALLNLHRTLKFENKIISKRHASFTFDGGKFFLKDLGSTNGTYLNEILIGGAESDPTPEAVEVKTGDIVRFGASRIALATNEVCEAIEGRLTLIPPRTITNETMGQDTLKSFTPFEGYREHEELSKKCSEKMTDPMTPEMAPEIRTCHQDTETESVATSVCGTQTMAENDSTTETIVKDSQAHVLSLWLAIVLAMAVIIGYQIYLAIF